MTSVTAADLEYGWNCESCGRPFHVGDTAVGVLVAVYSDGTVVEGEYRCMVCFVAGLEVKENTHGTHR